MSDFQSPKKPTSSNQITGKDLPPARRPSTATEVKASKDDKPKTSIFKNVHTEFVKHLLKNHEDEQTITILFEVEFPDFVWEVPEVFGSVIREMKEDMEAQGEISDAGHGPKKSVKEKSEKWGVDMLVEMVKVVRYLL